jgi:hypothetical protein
VPRARKFGPLRPDWHFLLSNQAHLRHNIEIADIGRICGISSN